MYFKRLKELRKQHNLTQQNVADLLFCQRSVYQRYESGVCEFEIH